MHGRIYNKKMEKYHAHPHKYSARMYAESRGTMQAISCKFSGRAGFRSVPSVATTATRWQPASPSTRSSSAAQQLVAGHDPQEFDRREFANSVERLPAQQQAHDKHTSKKASTLFLSPAPTTPIRARMPGHSKMPAAHESMERLQTRLTNWTATLEMLREVTSSPAIAQIRRASSPRWRAPIVHLSPCTRVP